MKTEGDFWNWQHKLTEALVEHDHAEDCSASGAVDESVAYAAKHAPIASILAELEEGDSHLMAYLREYGCWEAEELADHEANLHRMVWLLSGDWRENGRTS